MSILGFSIGRLGVGWGARGGILPKIMCYIDSGVFNSGEFKNDLFSFFLLRFFYFVMSLSATKILLSTVNTYQR